MTVCQPVELGADTDGAVRWEQLTGQPDSDPSQPIPS